MRFKFNATDDISKRRIDILNENMIHVSEVTEYDLELLGLEDNKYFFDTESGIQFKDKSIVEKYDLTRKSYKEIPEFLIPEKTDPNETEEERIARYNKSLAVRLKNEKQIYCEVYCWMFGCNNSDRVYYGTHLEEFFSLIDNINRLKCEKRWAIEPLTVYVHNLTWDIYHILYYLKDNHYDQLRVEYDEARRKTTYDEKKPRAFYITETDGTCHGGVIHLPKVQHFQQLKTKKKDAEFISKIDFRDSMKITAQSLEVISKKFIKVDDIYIKDKDNINYDLVRDRDNYNPGLEELWYIYCDIYLLKEWYNQFVVPMYIDEGVDPYTISQISFDLILKHTYADNVLRNKYKCEHDKKPLTDRQIYERHFCLKKIFGDPLSREAEYIRQSYSGGHTTASKHFKELASTNEATIPGVSFDITSSYPSAMCDKPLPYGNCYYRKGKYKNDTIKGELYDFHFITIAFDTFKPKAGNENTEFGLPIKLNLKAEIMEGSLSQEDYNNFGVPSNESATTNYINGVPHGSNRINVKNKLRAGHVNKFMNHRFVISLTHYEYEEWIKNFDFGYIEINKKYNRATFKPGVLFVDYLTFKSEVGHFEKGIMHFYKIKEENDCEGGNIAMKENAKLIINSFYGKHCSRRDREQKFYDFDKDIICFQQVTEENENEWIDPKLYAVHYGAGVTSHGRIKLMRTSRLICNGEAKFIYSDTDSIKVLMSKEELGQRLEEINATREPEKQLRITGINIPDKVLGDWDYEFTFRDIKVIGQKKYLYEAIDDETGESQGWTCKCCGLPKNIRDEIKSKEDFSIGSEFVKNQRLKVPGGFLLYPTPYSLKEHFWSKGARKQ